MITCRLTLRYSGAVKMSTASGLCWPRGGTLQSDWPGLSSSQGLVSRVLSISMSLESSEKLSTVLKLPRMGAGARNMVGTLGKAGATFSLSTRAGAADLGSTGRG